MHCLTTKPRKFHHIPNTFLPWTHCVYSIRLLVAIVPSGRGRRWRWMGEQTSQKLLPSTIVDMILADGIQRVRLYAFNTGVTDAFAHSDIDVMVTLPNQEIDVDPVTRAMYQRRNMTKAQAWISQNITDTIASGVRITHLLVGNEAIENTTYHNNVVVEQFKELQDAIDKDERLNKWNKNLTITNSPLDGGP